MISARAYPYASAYVHACMHACCRPEQLGQGPILPHRGAGAGGLRAPAVGLHAQHRGRGKQVRLEGVHTVVKRPARAWHDAAPGPSLRDAACMH